MAKSKQHEEIIQTDVELTEEIVAEVEQAIAPKDEYALPELKEKDKRKDPGHTRRDFRN